MLFQPAVQMLRLTDINPRNGCHLTPCGTNVVDRRLRTPPPFQRNKEFQSVQVKKVKKLCRKEPRVRKEPFERKPPVHLPKELLNKSIGANPIFLSDRTYIKWNTVPLGQYASCEKSVKIEGSLFFLRSYAEFMLAIAVPGIVSDIYSNS